MLLRVTRPIVAIAAFMVVLALVVSPASVPARGTQDNLTFPSYRALVRTVAKGSWAQQPALPPGTRVNALVQLDVAPLALVGGGWSHTQRRAYTARIATAQDQLAAAVTALGGSVLARFNHAGAGLAVSLDPAGLAVLGKRPDVLAIIRVGDYTVAQASPASQALAQAEVSTLLGADTVRRRGNNGTGVEIAVVDTGLDYTHQKLGGSGNPDDYRRAACGNPALAPGDSGCNPGLTPPADLFPNAKVRGGIDQLGDIWPNPDPRCRESAVCSFPDPNPIDLNGHGTHVADIAAGLPTTSGGIDSGIAPGANLWAYRACNAVVDQCEGVALLRAIDAALDLDGSDAGACTPGATPGCLAYDPADVIVLALSFSYGQPEDAVTLFADLAGYYGSLVVAAAGNDGDKPFIVGSPATAAAALAVAESTPPAPGGGEGIAPDASRGPRIADNGLKPDVAAPGAILSAQAGSGSAVTSFAGSSGAAPVAAGVAALLIQELEELGAIDRDPGLGVFEPSRGQRYSIAPLAKAVLMNNAADVLRDATGGPVPYTRQGAGRVNALGSFLGRTLAWDATAVSSLLVTNPELRGCSVQPYIDLINFLLFGTPPPCAAQYPSGDALFKAWNTQTGSVSFGYRPTIGFQELTRQVAVVNYSRSPRSYTLSTGLRFPDDAGRGVALSVSPERFDLAAASATVVTLTMTISPAALRDGTLNGGRFGNSGSASCASPTPEVDCPSLTLFEVEGTLLIDGGTNNRITVPVHVLPHKVADVAVSRVLEDRVLLVNWAPLKAGAVDAFALVDISPNKCDTRNGVCATIEYTPGDVPGSGQSPVDLQYIGVRSYAVPGLNANQSLPPTPPGALTDEVVEFAVTVWDRPYRASPNAPVQFEVFIDAEHNGTYDYVVFNADAGDGRDGRNAVFVRDINPADGVRPTRYYLFTDANFNSANVILPVPSAAVDLRSDRPFSFYVRALDAYFKGSGAVPWDCSPGPVEACGTASHLMQTDALRFRPSATTFNVPAAGRATVFFTEDPGGVTSSPAQLGLLMLYRDAQPGREAAPVRLR